MLNACRNAMDSTKFNELNDEKLPYCRHGHALTDDNLYKSTDKVTGKLVTKCRQCELDGQKKRYADKNGPKKVHAEAAKDFCPKGHAYAGDNLVIKKKKNGGFQRECRICKNETNRKSYQRNKSK